MKAGDYIRNSNTGVVLSFHHESMERAGTKERVVYVCRVVLPTERDGEIVTVSVYDCASFPFAAWEYVNEMEVLAWVSKT